MSMPEKLTPNNHKKIYRIEADEVVLNNDIIFVYAFIGSRG